MLSVMINAHVGTPSITRRSQLKEVEELRKQMNNDQMGAKELKVDIEETKRKTKSYKRR